MSASPLSRSVVTLALMCMSAGASLGAEVKLRDGDITYVLVPLAGPQAAEQSVGQYSYPMELTAGTVLYLFPDHHFAVATWCDICGRSSRAIGSYTIEDGYLRLAPERTATKWPLVEGKFSRLRLFLGRPQTLRTHVKTRQYAIGPSDVEALGRSSDGIYPNYMVRRSFSVDWQQEWARLRGDPELKQK